ncbi:hypothetical protein Tsubulata_039947 [Turnera subulata]|uniref:Nudix hydrolase domain-containing protein n=1 Tax=Turnera subulata TaxID=218843 RepID=A0A9Q0JE07_9ROSI|nr:hypothetical protein Tsubulata_039947 [Turnera subulata]
MEKDRDYKLLLCCPSGLSASQVSAVLDQSFDRIQHPDIELENSIATIWDQRVAKNASLFNGKKFRYGGYNLDSEGGTNQDSHVCLHLGLTDYRYLSLSLSLNYVSCFNGFCGDKLKSFVGKVPRSIRRKIILLQRSHNVGEFPGYFVFPGGHPEPEEAGIESHQSSKDLSASGLINKKASLEMFESIIREVVEEIGVPASSLCDPVFIGISRRVLNVRPGAFFFIKCSLHSDEIKRLYSSAQDGYESTQLCAVSLVDLENMASKMPGCHQGGFALYKLMVEASRNV